MPIYDFTCTGCDRKTEETHSIAKAEAGIKCSECSAPLERHVGAPHTFTAIVPTYPGSKKFKAGYVHQHVDRPAEKTQVGYGGAVSTAHPTGSTKNN